MTGRTYGQYCGLARAAEIIGERWTPLIIRDLILGPKRYSELRETLTGIPASLLSARLNELEQEGVVRRRVLPNLDAAVVYELTEYGTELEPVALQLAQWGARSLGDGPAPGETFTLDSAMLALYTTFDADAATGVRVTFQLDYGPFVVHAMVDNGALKVAEGRHAAAELAVELRGPFKPLLTGELSAREALERGIVRTDGDPALLSLFTRLFRIAPAPVAEDGLTIH